MHETSETQGCSEEYRSGTAFLLWLSCLFGVCGVHRFYLGKPWTGLLYVLTFGLVGIGQLLDLFWMRDMVLLANTKRKLLRAPASAGLLPPAQAHDQTEDLRTQLLRAAAGQGGRISVSQGVLATGQSFQAVERILDEMARSDYVTVDNDPETGAVVYVFHGL